MLKLLRDFKNLIRFAVHISIGKLVSTPPIHSNTSAPNIPASTDTDTEPYFIIWGKK
jgi:hypothetical protein